MFTDTLYGVDEVNSILLTAFYNPKNAYLLASDFNLILENVCPRNLIKEFGITSTRTTPFNPLTTFLANLDHRQGTNKKSGSE